MCALFLLFRNGHDEVNFLNSVQKEFSLGQRVVPLTDLFPEFTYDQACYVDKYSYSPNGSVAEKQQALGGVPSKTVSIPKLLSINFYYGLSFSKAGEVVGFFSFKPTAFAQDGFEMPHIIFEGHEYFFLKSSKACHEFKKAVLVARDVSTACCGVSREILLTDTEE